MLRTIRYGKLKHDTKNMLVAIVAIGAMPVTLWLMNDRPMHATTAQELAEKVQARQESKDDFWRKVPAPIVIFDHDDPSQAWLNLAEKHEASHPEATQVLQAARVAVGKECWPIFMEEGWLNDQPVWIVGSARGHQVGYSVGCFGTSRSDERLSHWQRLTATVETKAPFRVLWRTPEPIAEPESSVISDI